MLTEKRACLALDPDPRGGERNIAPIALTCLEEGKFERKRPANIAQNRAIFGLFL